MSAYDSAGAAAAAAAGAVLGLGVLRAFQKQLCFVARLEPTRRRWKNDQVCTTVLCQEKQMRGSVTVMSLRAIQQRERERKSALFFFRNGC